MFQIEFSAIACKPGTCHRETLRCRAQTALEMACEGADVATVTDLTCMPAEVDNILVSACYEAGAYFLDITGERRTQLEDAMVAIHNACKSATTQVCLYSRPAESST